jgi:DNA polymerase-3 subunit alpha
MKIRSALSDLGRRAGIQTSTMAFITGCLKELPDDASYAEFMAYAAKDRPILDFIQKYPDVIEKLPIVMGALKIPSIHAGGVVIVPQSKTGRGIFDQMPVKKVDGLIVTEWEMGEVEQAGFLKMDILGVRQLDKFTEIMQLIKEHTGKEIVLTDIPLDDKAVFEMFKEGYTEDVFQFQGVGLKGYVKKLEPDNINDLIATTALYRPGPMDMDAHNEYIRRKQNPETIRYAFGTEEILKETFGLPFYQEAIMKIVASVAGFTPNQADDIRKAIGKKLPELMRSYKEKFIEGAIKNGCPDREARKMWDDIEGFGGYSFNKSHSVCYAITGYFCQWFKVHYPVQFWLVALKYSSDDKLPGRLSEMWSIGSREIGGPDINKSTDSFTTDGKKIYWSLKSIKQVGEKAMTDILEIRTKEGEFFSVSEFATRTKGSSINKGTVVNLILTGAFDEIGKVPQNALSKRFLVLSEYMNFIGSKIEEPLLQMKNWQTYQWIIKQRQLCGLGILDVSGLAKIATFYDSINEEVIDKAKQKRFNYYSAEEVQSKGADLADSRKFPLIGGLLIKVAEKTILKAGPSKGNKFALLELSDGINILKVTLWSEQWMQMKDVLNSKINDLVFLHDVYVKFDELYSKAYVAYVTNKTKLLTIK